MPTTKEGAPRRPREFVAAIPRSQLATARKRTEAVHEKVGRVQLLLGVSTESVAGECAEEILVRILACERAATKPEDRDPFETIRDPPNRIRALLSDVAHELDRFNYTARREIRAGIIASIWTRIERRWARLGRRGPGDRLRY